MKSLAAVAAAALLLASTTTARADGSLIKRPGDHPDYRFEAEPHGLVGYSGPFGKGGGALGAGFRGTVIILDQGFIRSVNDTVGIGFGADFFFRRGTLYVPVVMQWNFWLSNHWSVFGEPGIGFAPNPEKGGGKVKDLLHPNISAGGRFHFNDRVALTLRVGYPSASVGVSFFF